MPELSIARIKRMLWEDQGEAALQQATDLKQRFPNDKRVTDILAECGRWTGHLVSREAYAEFYKSHRRSFVPLDAIVLAHERIPRLNQVRTWMLKNPPISILDLGTFDGFGLMNLVTGTGAEGIGVDLDEEALRHASQCSSQLALNCRWVHDMAERIDLGGNFDAVLVMELLEHVIDPKALLRAAEKHLSPGGRIYITTPGTPVPHFDNEQEAREHLRCLGKEELFDLIGDRVIEGYETLQPASHTEQVLVYRRPRTAFLVNPVAGGWTPQDEKSYRGSEEAVVGLAEQLRKEGHAVEVYHNPPQDHDGIDHNGVRYLPHRLYDASQPRDVLILKKWPRALDDPVDSRLIFLWTTDPHPKEDLPPARAQRLAKLVPLTKWHARELKNLNPDIPDELIFPIPYGIPEKMLNHTRLETKYRANPHTMVYASSFDRGLERLLDWWPQIREKVPDAELHVWYGWSMFNKIHGMVDQLIPSMTDSPGGKWKISMERKMQQDGIVDRGETTPYDPTPFLEAALWAYPCIGGERFCLTGVKAQALGAIPVVVPTMALDETVQNGVKTDHEHYVEALIYALTHEDWQKETRAKMVEESHGALSWAAVVKDFWRPLWAGTLKTPTREDRTRLPEKRQTLTATFITLNSEGMFVRALRSVKGIADEIVCVDQGSTDRTLEMAKQFGAIIVEGMSPFQCLQCKKVMPSDHFGETDHEPFGFEGPRNQSVSQATSDWILWLDTDEELTLPENLHKYLRRNCFLAYGIKQHHFSVQPPNIFKPDLPCRVFRNGMGIRFFGKVHEHPEIGLNQGITPATILGDVDIAHDGYFHEAGRRNKFKRNIGLMRADRRKYPHRLLGKYLWLRDLIHLTRYALEQAQGRLTKDVMVFCEEAVELFEGEFLEKTNLYAMEGLPYYSEALRILNRGFEVQWSLSAAPTGAQPGEVRHARFSSLETWKKHLTAHAEGMVGNFTGKYV